MAKIMKEDDNVKYWAKAWENSGLTDDAEYSKKQIKKNIFDWIDKSYNDRLPYHAPYQRQIYIKLGGFRCLLNKYKKL